MNVSDDTISVTTFSCASRRRSLPLLLTMSVFLLYCVALLGREADKRSTLKVELHLLRVTSLPSPPPPSTRERQPDNGEGSLASSPLEAMRRSNLSLGEKQEDADNQKNSTRASQAGLNSNTIHIPVTITAPPGETTIIPSE